MQEGESQSSTREPPEKSILAASMIVAASMIFAASVIFTACVMLAAGQSLHRSEVELGALCEG